MAAARGALKARAARFDITPDATAIPPPYTSILDPLYARAIYLENGHDRAVLLSADIGAIATASCHTRNLPVAPIQLWDDDRSPTLLFPLPSILYFI